MKRGDIVLGMFPHASSTPSKNRPVLVVQADFYNQRINNFLVAVVTSNLTRRNDPAHFFVNISTAEGQSSGLNRNSLVSCLNFAVLPRADLINKIGELPTQFMQQIDECLKAAFGLV